MFKGWVALAVLGYTAFIEGFFIPQKLIQQTHIEYEYLPQHEDLYEISKKSRNIKHKYLIKQNKNVGYDYYKKGDERLKRDDYEGAINSFLRAISNARANGNPVLEAWSLFRIAEVYRENLDAPDTATQYYNEVLAKDSPSLQNSENYGYLIFYSNRGIGYAHSGQGEYSAAIEYLESALRIKTNYELSGIEAHEAWVRRSLAWAYNRTGSYALALERIDEAIELFAKANESSAIAGSFDIKASILENLGRYRSSEELYEDALESFRENCRRQLESCNSSLEAVILNNLGFLYNRENNSRNALSVLNEALDICSTGISARTSCGEEFIAKIYTNIAAAYYGAGNIESAIENVNEAIRIRKLREDYDGLGRPYWQLGLFYESSGNIEKALDYYQESLSAVRLSGDDREGEARTLKYLGDLWARQGRSDLGAIFLKQSVLVYESIREDNVDLSEELKDSYTKTIESTYRLLATLLIRQGRVYEAQRVLELLKAEELRRFTRANWTNDTLTYEGVEGKVVKAHDSLIALGSKLYACEPNCDTDLLDLRRDLNGQYQDAIRTLEATVSRNLAQDPIFGHPSSLASKARALVNSKPGTLLIYPIITKDEVWLLWSATGGVVGVVRAPNGIGLEEVGDAALNLRLKLQNPQDYPLSELKVEAKKLYDWLIAPLAEEIDKNDIEYLIFAQDRFTRYVPMGVLFDGKNYLIEKFTINTILSAESTDTDETLGESDSSPILALGVEDALKNVSINNENKNFSALPNVEEELNAIVRNNRDPNDQKGFYPGLIFRNKEVTFENIARNVTRSRILHIATHGEFVPDTDGDSYLLLGDKSILKAAADNDLKDIETLGSEFYNLHLVVLSACETALGGKKLDGTEIAGVSSYFLGTGKAETVLATLWKVDDAGTSILMQRFYEILATGKATKAEALQHAMLSLLYDEEEITERLAALESGRRGFDLDLSEVSAVESSHPYYWAPFVLIGNGL